MEFMSKEKFEEAEKIEKLRNKMLKYIVYKKRTEAEIRQKFEEEDYIREYDEYLRFINTKNSPSHSTTENKSFKKHV